MQRNVDKTPEHFIGERVCFDVNGPFEDFVVRINAIVSALLSFTNLQSQKRTKQDC